MWHSDDLLEGSFVIPATIYHPGIDESENDNAPTPRSSVSLTFAPAELLGPEHDGLTADTLATMDTCKNYANDGGDDDNDDGG